MCGALTKMYCDYLKCKMILIKHTSKNTAQLKFLMNGTSQLSNLSVWFYSLLIYLLFFYFQIFIGVCVCMLSCVQIFATPWTVVHQAPLVHGTFQARILEWVTVSSSRGSSQPRDWTHVSCVSCLSRQFLYH